MEQEKRFERKVGERGQVTIPIELREQFGLTSGEKVIFIVGEDGEIVLQKSENNDELAAAYQRTANRDKKINAEWEHVSVEAIGEIGPENLDRESSFQLGLDDEYAVDQDTGLSEIDRIATSLNISPSVAEVASVIYRQARNKDLVLLMNMENVIASEHPLESAATGALVAACQERDVHQSLEEIAEISSVEAEEIERAHQYLSNELDLDIYPIVPKEFVPRFCSELGLSGEVQSKANEIIETTAEKRPLSGESPTSFAAAAVYAASLLCNEKKTISEIAEVAQVTEASLRNNYQQHIEGLDIHS